MLTTQEAAKALGVGRHTVRYHIKNGNLRAVRMGRDWFIHEEDLDAVRGMKPGAKPKILTQEAKILSETS